MPPPATTPASGAGTAMRPYLRTHGKQVARLHLFDWIVLLLLVAMYAVLGLLQPFHRFVAEDMMASLRYPMKDNTVPSWAVPVWYIYATPHLLKKKSYAFWVPCLYISKDEIATAISTIQKLRTLIVFEFIFKQIIAIVVPMIFIVGIYIKRRNVYDLHHAILGRLSSYFYAS